MMRASFIKGIEDNKSVRAAGLSLAEQPPEAQVLNKSKDDDVINFNFNTLKINHG